MSKRRRILLVVAWCGAILALFILLVVFVRPSGLECELWRFSGFDIQRNHCEFRCLIEGRAAAFPDWWAGTWESQARLGTDDAYLEVRKARGVPVHGRQLALRAETWWLVLALLQPGLWLFAVVVRESGRVREGCCAQCGYDLRGSRGSCPECGANRTG